MSSARHIYYIFLVAGRNFPQIHAVTLYGQREIHAQETSETDWNVQKLLGHSEKGVAFLLWWNDREVKQSCWH
jgi:hypothetical protein